MPRRTSFRGARTRTTVLVALVVCALSGAASGAPPAAPARAWTRVAEGVEYRTYDITSGRGVARAHLLAADLSVAGVSVGLLYPGAVAARSPLSTLADAAGATGGVNGDFFHMTESQHPGVEATGAAVGPVVADGRDLKAAVPNGQRFGPALPPGTNTRQVIGVDGTGRARLGELVLEGAVSTPTGELPLKGHNQYALPVGSVGVFDKDWGSPSRVRATCGTDTQRGAPCSTETYEVTVRGGKVVSVADTPGGGAIASGTEVLVGREAGARELRKLAVGDAVGVRHELVSAGPEPGAAFRFAVGGYPVLRDGVALPGMDGVTAAVRTAAGIADGGTRLLLLALDGGADFRSGLSVVELAEVMRGLGASDAVNLDGGGSSTLVARVGEAQRVSVLNHPSGGFQRPVPNGIGVFVRA
ncbi:phosphodiester glycosidase family protein [Streptomyces sp. SP18CS02]|uniref:phosphodiester glycosidase family protein n=1 Tax=Streptomyces sp. SP18CS02 TaxID=3002531 RepID=UPI002E78F5B5|nr:phosphodiester glycosidase family protein [Streptomyces sp. SP18CS02]MEE1752086.1 phosphodiester glycosidase family protein [Streptomyces sp. SP18CS02]